MLRIVTGNRQEILLDHLAERLRVPADARVLQAETLVCERGVDRWLWQQLAERHGIAANLDCVLPATFLWRTLRRLVHHNGQERDPYEGALVRWRLQRLVPALLATGNDELAPVARYLAGDADGRRLAQLAARVAGLFDSYLVYRPDLIAAWDADRPAPADIAAHAANERWQRRLWQALTADAEARHRVTLMQDFCADADRGRLVLPDDLPARVSVFGLPALPPTYVDILVRLAQHIDIDLYVLSPSRHFWGELLSPAAMGRIEAATGYAFDIDNRLLAANGQPVRHFLATLAEQAAVHEDAFVAPRRDTLLGRLQADILDLTESRGQVLAADDNSLALVAAYGPMREVEILHDALLAMFADDPTLTPRDVLVLAPDIARYAPLVDAVFAAAGGARHIPYTLADVPLRGSSPVPVALGALLRLPDSRCTVNDVLALLETPAIAARWQCLPGDLDLLRGALHTANVHWGLDGAARAREGLPDDDTHTWQFALRRLFMGLAVERDDRCVLGVAPGPVFAGQNAELLGRLQDFIDALALWQQRLGAPQPATAWADTVQQLLQQFFRATDADDDAALAAAEAAVTAFRDEIAAAGFDGTLSPAVFRDDFLARLDTPAGSGGLLLGAVTFARLQPMRSLPHRVICLLGMDGDAFPRRQPRSDFDLVELAPRAGDRARRLDDRHLFLETLLSARDRLYISYTGRSARDDSVREPSVLVGELLDAVVAMHGGDAARDAIRARLLATHPLQPFSARYFDGSEPRLASFDDDWLVAARGRAGDGGTRPAFCPAPLPPPPATDGTVPLAALLRFFAHPARSFLRERLDIHLDSDDDSFDDDEPFALDGRTHWQLAEAWLSARIAGSGDADWRALQQARGTLPAGAFAALALAALDATVTPVHDALDGRVAELHDVRIDIALPGGRLTGVVRHVNADGVLRWSTARLGGRRALGLWIEHLALCATGQAATSTLVTASGPCTLVALAKDDAIARLAELVALRAEGLCAPLHFFPESAWAYVTGKKPEQDARLRWHGSDYGGSGEGSDPAWRILFDHLDDIVDARFETLAQRVYAPLLAALQAAEAA